MSTARSDGVYEKLRESTEKFDYFILGVVGALCAYISQTFKPERIGLNPGTLELLALLVLVLGAIFGFRRVEQVNLATLVNYRVLHANERRGVLVSVIQNGTGVNTETGAIYSPGFAAQEIPKIAEQLKQLQPKLASAQARAQLHYKLRNAFILIGFLMLLAAKLSSAYV